MDTEHAYKLRQTNMGYTDTLREVNTKYCTAIADLKEKLEVFQSNYFNVNVLKCDYKTI
jgi:hypothetical protein